MASPKFLTRMTAALIGALALLASPAGAAQPEPWGLGLQAPATEIMTRIDSFHDLLLWIIVVVTLFVTALLLIVMVKFNAKKNPNPSKTTHNTFIEMAWTVVPVIILIVIAIPSFRLLYYQDVIPKADLTVKAIGHQWYWSYQYPDNGKFEFDSLMVPDDELKKGQVRLLSVDNPVVVPVNATVRVITTSEDVIHSWAIPAFGVKKDSVTGRLNEMWFKAKREGVYYGQCSELCGTNHGFMPIEVRVVSQAAFDAWVLKAKKEFAAADTPAPGRLAALR